MSPEKLPETVPNISCTEYRGGWMDAALNMVSGGQLNVSSSIKLAVHAVSCRELECRTLASVTNTVLKDKVRAPESLRPFVYDLLAPKPDPVHLVPEEQMPPKVTKEQFPHALMERIVPLSSLVRSQREPQKAA